MNEPDSSGPAPETTTTADAPTPEQTALLQYLNLLPAEGLTRAEADSLISQLEAAPDWEPHLQAWHRDKTGLHPELFAVPHRSFREARWWQSQVADGSLYGYNFRQPSVNQAMVILESLDRQLPGWDQESKKRRTHRFMNEMATLSPELCKPGCSFPHELPEEGDESADAPPPIPAFVAPSAPSFTLSAPAVPSGYAAISSPAASPDRPAWEPSVQPPLQAAAAKAAPGGRKGLWKWALLLLFLAAGAGAYGYFDFHAADPVRRDAAKSAAANGAAQKNAGPKPFGIPPAKALDSQRRAMEMYPDLAQAGTPLNQTFVAMVKQLEIERSPRLQQADWPEQVARQCAKALLIAPATRKGAPAVPANPPPPADRPHAVVTPPTAPVAAASPAAASPPAASPAGGTFVSLEAAYAKTVNLVKYRHHGAPEEASVKVDIHNMMPNASKLTVRCVFFKRPTGHGDQRSVLASTEKHVELAGGQVLSDVFDSPPVYRGRGATEEFDGWLVQLLEGSGQCIKQIGSNGNIEELGKTMAF